MPKIVRYTYNDAEKRNAHIMSMLKDGWTLTRAGGTGEDMFAEFTKEEE